MQLTTEPMQPPQTYSYDVAAGTVRVLILASHIHESTMDGKKITTYDHLVRVTTDEITDTGHECGFLTIRGRRYRFDREHRRERDPWISPQGQLIRWTWWYSPHGGGFRTDRDSDVNSSTKAYDELRQIELEVLERFEADLPDWHRISERMSDLQQLQRWQDIAATHRTELAEAEQRIAHFTARITT